MNKGTTATLVILAWVIGFSMSSDPSNANIKTEARAKAKELRMPVGSYEIQRDLRVYVVPDQKKLTAFCHKLTAYYGMPSLPADTLSCASVTSGNERKAAWMAILPPGKWDDISTQHVAGHELWHTLGETHE